MIRNVVLADSEAQECNSQSKEHNMAKKQHPKKTAAKTKDKCKKRSRCRESDLMRRDRKACIMRDKELAKAGVKPKCKDILKDDCCYGCKSALENKDAYAPFDRRFVCDGFSRFTHQIGVAAGFLAEGYSAKDETTKIRFLMKVQKELLYLAMIIGERVEKGKLECIETNGKPSCFVGAKLDEWLTIK